ncbi:Photosystem I chlorophyll a apoprotein A2 [compost metagenome]
MKNRTTYLLIVLTALFASYADAQQQKLVKAGKLYDNYAYIDAIKIYENIASKGYKSVELFEKLGNAYYFNSEFAEANRWYTELFALGIESEPEYYYRFSQTLKSIGDYEKSAQMMKKFVEKNSADERGRIYEEDKDYLAEIKRNSGRYTIENAGINSEGQDYGTAFFDGKLVFASSRQTSGLSKTIDKRTGLPFTNLFASTVKSDGTFETPEKFSGTIDSKFHEATPAFAKDGKTMYFTRNNYNEGKKRKSSEKKILLKLYKAVLEKGKWTNVTELPFNSNEYSTAHPALSPDDKTLYFVSDRPGTLGQSDIYKVSINSDGTFGNPENLGRTINTEGKETYPFVSDENELYFSSDGYPGLGGLDIFKSRIENNDFSKPLNVGEPVNGRQDDFAFMIDTKSQAGFFSSNREGGMGYDDIYRFKENKKLECEQLLAGRITDQQAGTGLENVKVSLLDNDFKLLETAYTDAYGNYSFKVECGKKYRVRIEKKEYLADEKSVTISKDSGTTILDIEQQKRLSEIGKDGNIAAVFGIREIHFDFDSWNIREDAAIDLQKIIEVMREYPSMTVAIRSHTDSRGNDDYNQLLSEKRAQATKHYMISQGIDSSRLSAKGYGETQLKNKCDNDAKCTDKEHQENRRSEFIILKIR